MRTKFNQHRRKLNGSPLTYHYFHYSRDQSARSHKEDARVCAPLAQCSALLRCRQYIAYRSAELQSRDRASISSAPATCLHTIYVSHSCVCVCICACVCFRASAGQKRARVRSAHKSRRAWKVYYWFESMIYQSARPACEPYILPTRAVARGDVRAHSNTHTHMCTHPFNISARV